MSPGPISHTPPTPTPLMVKPCVQILCSTFLTPPLPPPAGRTLGSAGSWVSLSPGLIFYDPGRIYWSAVTLCRVTVLSGGSCSSADS